MATGTVAVSGRDIPVVLPAGLAMEKLRTFKPFNDWVDTLSQSLALQGRDASHPFHGAPYELRGIEVQSFDARGPRLSFVKLRADVSTAAGGGEALSGSVFLRGPSVAMLVVLIPHDDDDDDGSAPAPSADGGSRGKGKGEGKGDGEEEEERYVLLTVQPRVPAGSLAFVELPAGRVDDEDGDGDGDSKGGDRFAVAAAREIKEELHMDVLASELRCLNDMASSSSSSSSPSTSPDQNQNAREQLAAAVYPSAGGCDEHIRIYLHERRLPRRELAEYSGKHTGLREEGERITLKLVPMRELWREAACDAKALAAVALWEGLRREGKV